MTIIRAGEKDLPEIVNLHKRCFQDYFLTELGEEIIEFYYKNYWQEPKHIILIAKAGSKVCGFVAGTLDFRLFYRNFFVKNFWVLTKVAIIKFITNKKTRKRFLKRILYLKRIIPDLENRRKAKKAVLLSVAVDESLRKRGIGLLLLREFTKEAKKQGANFCRLSVKKDNLTAIEFYKKAGWQIEKSNKNLLVFSLRL